MIRFRSTEVSTFPRLTAAAAALCLVAVTGTATGATGISHAKPRLKPRFIQPTAFDVSAPLRDLAPLTPMMKVPNEELIEIRTERDLGRRPSRDHRSSRDGALQRDAGFSAHGLAIPGANLTFEGMSNQDNFNVFGGRVNPPDPVGAVGPNNYVEMINLVYAIYDKSGNLLMGPVDTGTLWAGFAIPDCTDPSGDPVVLYDQLADRWLLSQFTSGAPYLECVALSQTSDPSLLTDSPR